ncbi:MAG TPA: oligosaccharide flippase family protein [Phnomibacter sp.]|jgi:O-antigen/teichoic acid export membrane protein|nr:oligosaccharide flippase family protein [Phnomibacter sp.]
MNPLTVIRKNAGWYGLNIFVTGSSAFVGIILSKQLLSPEDFLQFNLLANGVTLLNNFLIGWFVQSIIRFYHSYHLFFRIRNILLITAANFLVISIPVFFLWRSFIGIGEPVIQPIVFMFINALYTILLALYQATHQAKTVAASETLRSSIIIIGLLAPFLSTVSIGASYFWILWIVSCLLPALFLFVRRKKLYQSRELKEGTAPAIAMHNSRTAIKNVLQFGLPLSGWMFVSFLLLNSDKWYLYKCGLPPQMVANYVALSDIMMRGVGFLFSPIVTSTYPVISKMFDDGRYSEVQFVMKRVVTWELLLSTAAVAGFVISHRLIFALLRINDSPKMFLWIGLLLIVVHTLWQISAMFHKIGELRLKTAQLLLALLLATALVYIAFYKLVVPASLPGVMAVFSSGFVVYFIYSFLLFKTFKWNKIDE